jgi:tryptophan synthase alpha chain
VLGVTGSRDQLSDTVEGLIVKLKALTKVPICVGFGISKPDHAAAIVRAGADGVIIGSKVVSLIESNLEDKNNMKLEITAFLGQVKEAISNIKS